jgi:uncharacterized protein (DUF1778 family)
VLNVLPETLKKQLPCTAEYRSNSMLDEKEHAMPQKPARTSRIEARIAPDALKVVKRAAEIQGRSVSDFVVAAAQEVATRTIEDAYIIRLSVEDQRAFVEAVLNPPLPSIGLLKAAEAYRTLIKASR